MKRKYSIIPAVLIMAISLTGCGKNNEAGGERYTDQARPIGYYSNENHNKGNATILEDNDGPLTEMMDHTAGDEGKTQRQETDLQMRQENSNAPIRTISLADKGNPSAHYDQSLSRKIEKTADRVENVRNVRAIAFGNKIVIAVDLSANAGIADTKKAIEKEVTPLAAGRKIKITTDRESYKKAKSIKNELRNGNYEKHTISELDNLFQAR